MACLQGRTHYLNVAVVLPQGRTNYLNVAVILSQGRTTYLNVGVIVFVHVASYHHYYPTQCWMAKLPKKGTIYGPHTPKLHPNYFLTARQNNHL